MSCDICGHKTKTENGIKFHKKKKHEVPQLDWKLCVGEDKKVETQFDVFCIIGTEDEICGPNLADQTKDLTEKYYYYKLIHKGHT